MNMAQDDIQRLQATATSTARSEAENAVNSAANAAQINALEAALNAIPVVGTLAAQVGNALYAALNNPPLPVDPRRKTPQNDPIKLFAFAVIMALLKFVWCFIKLLLNPLPIIGVFFPLCGSSDDSATQALGELDRKSAEAASRRQAAQTEGLLALRANNRQAGLTPVDDGRPEQGMSFDEFVRLTTPAASTGVVEGSVNRLVAQSTVNTTAARPVEGTQEARTAERVLEGEPTQGKQDLKKAFGL